MRRSTKYRPLPQRAPNPTNVWVQADSRGESWTYDVYVPRQIQICVVYNHMAYPNQWVMHCYRLGLDTELLPQAVIREDAQQQALNLVTNFLISTLTALGVTPK